MLPNLLIVGVQKSGTSTLYKLLSQHSDIFTPHGIKECHFFDRQYSKGLDWYLTKYFKEYTIEKYAMDATPDYCLEEAYIQRIYQDLGADTKIILSLRNPVDRLYSQYCMHYGKGYEKYGLMEAVSRDAESTKPMHNYIKRGMYASQLEVLYRYFDKKNIHIMWFDDYAKDMKSEVEKILSFLELDASEIDYSVINVHKRRLQSPGMACFLRLINAAKLASILPDSLKHKIIIFIDKFRKSTNKALEIEKMTAEQRNYLYSFYKDDLIKLEIITKRQLSAWKYE